MTRRRVLPLSSYLKPCDECVCTSIARKDPDAEAVKLLGWAGLLPTIYPWVQAFIWAFKPTNIVDIRRFPRRKQES